MVYYLLKMQLRHHAMMLLLIVLDHINLHGGKQFKIPALILIYTATNLLEIEPL